MKVLEQFHVSRAQGFEVQIREFARGLIISGQLASGARLPTTEELARLWNVGNVTVQNALAPLVKEGLLIRRPKAGTFVRQREAKLTCVGICNSATGYGASLYLHALHTALKEELAKLDIEMDVWLDPRPDPETSAPWMPLVKAAEYREFQALIVTGTNPRRFQWQQRLPVPTAFLSSGKHPNRVGTDLNQMVEVSLQALAAQGCRSVGVILPGNPECRDAAGGRSGWADVVERLLGKAGELGLAVRNEWLRFSTLAADDPAAPSAEEFGYREFEQLWQQRERPAGLIVWPDTVVRGAILAMRERQVRVPAELKLVLGKNESVDLLCPMPATFVVFSERATARALIEQVQKQFRGEPCEPVLVPFSQEAHHGSRPQETNNPQ